MFVSVSYVGSRLDSGRCASRSVRLEYCGDHSSRSFHHRTSCCNTHVYVNPIQFVILSVSQGHRDVTPPLPPQKKIICMPLPDVAVVTRSMFVANVGANERKLKKVVMVVLRGE